VQASWRSSIALHSGMHFSQNWCSDRSWIDAEKLVHRNYF
jgi:hypothetical protein